MSAAHPPAGLPAPNGLRRHGRPVWSALLFSRKPTLSTYHTALRRRLPSRRSHYDDLSRWGMPTWLLGSPPLASVTMPLRSPKTTSAAPSSSTRDQAALKEMGITMIKDRVRIQAAIKLLNKRCADAALARRPSGVSFRPCRPSPPRPLRQRGRDRVSRARPPRRQLRHAMSPASAPTPWASVAVRCARGHSPSSSPLSAACPVIPPPPTTSTTATASASAQRAASPWRRTRQRLELPPRRLPHRPNPHRRRRTSSQGQLHRRSAAPAIVGASSSSLSSARHLHGHGLHSTRPSTGHRRKRLLQSWRRLAPIAWRPHLQQPTAATFGGAAASINAGRPSTATGAQTYSGAGINATNSVVQRRLLPAHPHLRVQLPRQHTHKPVGHPAAAATVSSQRLLGRAWAVCFVTTLRRLARSVLLLLLLAHASDASIAARRLEGLQLHGFPVRRLPTSQPTHPRRPQAPHIKVHQRRGQHHAHRQRQRLPRRLRRHGTRPQKVWQTPQRQQLHSHRRSGPTGDELGATETWGIFATTRDGQNTKALSDNELLAICHAPQPHDPLRERGLTPQDPQPSAR